MCQLLHTVFTYKPTTNQTTALYDLEGHLGKHNTSNLGADGPQQQKTGLRATPVGYEQKTEPTICMGLTKLDNRKLENIVWWWWVSCDIQMVQSELVRRTWKHGCMMRSIKSIWTKMSEECGWVPACRTWTMSTITIVLLSLQTYIWPPEHNNNNINNALV